MINVLNPKHIVNPIQTTGTTHTEHKNPTPKYFATLSMTSQFEQQYKLCICEHTKLVQDQLHQYPKVTIADL